MIGFANSEIKFLLIFKSLKQDIDLNVKLEKKNHISGEFKEFLLLQYLLPDNITDIWPKKNAYQHTELKKKHGYHKFKK